MFRHDVCSAKLWVCADGYTHAQERSLCNTSSLGLSGFVLATLGSFHCVDIYADAPALAWWEAVRDKPLLNFKLIHGRTPGFET